MNKSLLSGIAIALACSAMAGTTFGQSAAGPNEPTPVEPLLPRAHDGTWTITYKYKESPLISGKAATAPPDRIAAVKVEKKGKIYHIIITKTSGGVSENWCVEDMEIAKPEGGKNFVRLTPENPLYIDFSKTDFDELSWIGMDDFKGVKEGSAGSKIFIFEVKNSSRRPTAQEAASMGNLAVLEDQQAPANKAGDKESKAKKAAEQMRTAQYGDTVSRATLDVLSQLPVEYDNGYFERAYSFSTTLPPNAPMEILQLLQTMREQKRRTFVRASPP